MAVRIGDVRAERFGEGLGCGGQDAHVKTKPRKVVAGAAVVDAAAIGATVTASSSAVAAAVIGAVGADVGAASAGEVRVGVGVVGADAEP